MKRYKCAARFHGQKDWFFWWDQAKGIVAGPAADEIRAIAAAGEVLAHPQPWSVKLSASPLKSARDMAAIIGYGHVLPADLAAHYPVADSDPVGVSIAEDGTKAPLEILS